MRKKSIHDISLKIAQEILTIYTPEPVICDRAQMMLRETPTRERNMGGRNKASIAEVIENGLRSILEGKE